MSEDELLRCDLREMVTRVESYYHSEEGKVSFSDVLRLIQHRNIDDPALRADFVNAQWLAELRNPKEDLAA